MRTFLLDCTLRDGGYYTNWDFDEALVSIYLECMVSSGVDILEIGYRNHKQAGYHGEYFYLPVERVNWIQQRFKGDLAVLVDVKSVDSNSIRDLLHPIIGSVGLIRFAAKPSDLKRAYDISMVAKEMGFKVAFNVMYFSDWWSNEKVLSQLSEFGQQMDFVYLVDSYGAAYPAQVNSAVSTLTEHGVRVGFHGHNNLELALANTLEAIGAGAVIVDSTVTGMGRGAGNLKTELLLTSFFGSHNLPVNFESLTKVVSQFESLKAQYGWGTSLPYMVAGARSFPQGKVMDWISTRYYSLQEVVVGLTSILTLKSRKSYQVLSPPEDASEVFVIGGGKSVVHHLPAILSFVKQKPGMVLLFASSRHFRHFESATNEKIVVLVGNEAERLKGQVGSFATFAGRCVIAPAIRELPEIVPVELEEQVFEPSLDKGRIADDISSHTAVALQTCLAFGPKCVFVGGYDGYVGEEFVGRTKMVHLENESLFIRAIEKGLRCDSITPTSYSHLEENSVYGMIT